MKTFALIVFIAVYAVMIFKQKYRVYAAVAAALIYLIAGVVRVPDLPELLNFNVLLMISGMMLTVYYFIESGMPMKIADFLLDKSKNMAQVTIFLSLFAGIISAFIDNVATVLMIAPVAIAIAKKKNVSPVAMIISISVSSNLQGAATLVGDTTSILLGAYARMNFSDFFFMNGRPGIFWAVELGALATIPIMMFLFRDMKEPVEADERTQVRDLYPTLALVLTVVVLIAASFFKNRPELTNGIICMGFGLSAMIYSFIKTRSGESAKGCMREFDKETVILLAALFVVVGGVSSVGIIDDLANIISRLGEGSVFVLYTAIVWGSVAVSAFIDNIPYVTTMLPVVAGIASRLGMDPNLLFFGLLTGATLGGNLSPIGASANIAGIGILKKNGYAVSNRDFTRISVPFTLAAVTVGYLFIWFVWH